ncbi:hypothetical protein A2U01_0104489, partial [Trifolium medium]|nr:hypothetical protein [Trifolium medium]
GGDKGAPAVDAHLGATSLPPLAASSASPSFWDPLFNPVEFIERQLCMIGDTVASPPLPLMI